MRLSGFRRFGAVASALALAAATGAAGERLDILEATGLRVVGYADRLSLQPGERVRFMVSTTQPRYRLEVVRLLHGDEGTRGPGFREEPIEAAVNGEHRGRLQTWRNGSFATVPDHAALRLTGSFTVTAWIYPTTPRKGVQGLVAKWSANAGGYALVIEEDGSLGLWLSGAGGQVKVRTDRPLRATQPINGSFQDDNWYFVAAAYDAAASRVTLYQKPRREWPGDASRAVVERSVSIGALRASGAPLLFAACPDPAAASPADVVAHFNGKIEAPRLFGAALGADALSAVEQGRTPAGAPVVAAWDFARELSTSRVVDTARNALHGRTVNRPGRAVTGHNWSGHEINHRHASAEYGAIYFHDDDLEDAGWSADVEWQIPPGLKSGFYAARVRVDGGEDHIPFYIRPKKGAPGAPVAYLVPTFTHQAYANIGNACAVCRRAGSLGLYGRHSDGSGVFYSSTQRPIFDMRPKAVTRWSAGGRTPRHYSADLYLIQWLETKGFAYDVITDHDLHAEGKALLEPYRVVMTGSHPEYVSEPMRNAVRDYLESGGRVMYLGGNGFYWVTSVAPDNPNVIEVRRWGGTQGYEAAPGEWYHSTTGELGGLWRFRGQPPQKLVGIGFTAEGFDKNSIYKRESGSRAGEAAFIFEGVEGEVIGDFESSGGMGRGAAGDELDRFEPALGSPPSSVLLARARDFSDAYQFIVEEVMETNPRLGGTVNEKVRADMVYVKYPNGGAVFSAGSISWFGSLYYNNYDNAVSRIMENVLKRFSMRGPVP
jgi:N,N-dimethylformamidase